jgi:hypothetical protein
VWRSGGLIGQEWILADLRHAGGQCCRRIDHTKAVIVIPSYLSTVSGSADNAVDDIRAVKLWEFGANERSFAGDQGCGTAGTVADKVLITRCFDWGRMNDLYTRCRDSHFGTMR